MTIQLETILISSLSTNERERRWKENGVAVPFRQTKGNVEREGNEDPRQHIPPTMTSKALSSSCASEERLSSKLLFLSLSLAMMLYSLADWFIKTMTSLLQTNRLRPCDRACQCLHLVAPCLQRIGLAKPPPCCDHTPVPTLPTEPSPRPRKTPLPPRAIMPYGYGDPAQPRLSGDFEGLLAITWTNVSEVDPMLHSTLNEIERQKKRMRTKLSPKSKAVDTRI